MKTDMIDLGKAVVVVPPDLSSPEKRAVAMLVEEVEKRTRVRWPSAATWPETPAPVIAVGPASALRGFCGPYADECGPRTSVGPRTSAGTDGQSNASEGYRIRVKPNGPAPAVLVIGNDARGVLFGVGHLLRTLRMRSGYIALPADCNVTAAPRYRLRGHQLGYRDKTNSYCGWDLPQWEQYIRDLAVFGTNAIELIPPRSDDRPDSVHFPRPPLEMMAGMSRIADAYGIDVWIWYPAMDPDYADPATGPERSEGSVLAEWGQVFRALPRIDALFVPGGDPGRTRPRHLMPMLEKQAALLRSIHPRAQMWISPQGFTREWMDEFVSILRAESPDWLDGVVFGPWIHTTTAAFRELIPDRYPIRNYPDITHNLNCQHPVPDWDVAYALTEGRESINPRPLGMAAIFRHEQPPTIGFLSYSEGCNDDVNKCIWSALGWDPQRKVVEVLREYSRYFVGGPERSERACPERSEGTLPGDDLAQGLLALERNWQGPLACNAGVYTTLQQFQAMEAAASPADLKNWRFQQALYRAYYDAYVRSRLLYESGLEEQALDQLRQAPEKGSLVALAGAEWVLDQAAGQAVGHACSVTQRIANGWRTRIHQLAEALFQSIHMQLSVPLYRAQEEVRGANLDGIDYPLNNRPWLKERFAAIRQLGEESGRLEAIRAILEWTNPGPGGFYDDLSNDLQRPHLVRPMLQAPVLGGVLGPGFAEDPAFLRSPMRHYPYRKDPRPLRLAWRCRTGSLNDAPFEMHYPDLDPGARYKVRIVYSDAEPRVKVRLEAKEATEVATTNKERPADKEATSVATTNADQERPGDGIEVHPFILKPLARDADGIPIHAPVEFDIPPEATQGGALTLRWYREAGRGGAGRGCEVCEVWLIKI